MFRVQVRHASRAMAMAPRRALFTIPQPPGGIVGTVNEAVKTPPHDPVHGSYHWSFEKIISVSIVPLAVAPFAVSNGTLIPVLDAALGSLLVGHVHMGLQSCIIDYIPKRVYGKYHKAAMYALTAGSVVALYGLYEFETNDVGITETIQKVWKA